MNSNSVNIEQLKLMDKGSFLDIKGRDELNLPCLKYRIWKRYETLFLLFNRATLKTYRLDHKTAFEKGMKHKEYESFSRADDLVEYFKNKIK